MVKRAAIGIVGLLVAVAAGAGSLALRGSGSGITAHAVVSDVADMAEGAPVMLADVTVGSVTDISLTDDHRARVTMSIDEDAGVPADVTARVRRTSVLGERFVELRPAPDLGDDPTLLADGATIEQTEVVPDFEQLVASGAATLGALSAGELAQLLHEGARGFGDRGGQLRTLLAGLDTVVAGYQGRSEAIETLIRSIDTLAAAVGPHAESHAEAITHLAEATRTLATERDAIVELLRAVRDLSAEGRRILDAHMTTIRRQIQGLRVVTGVLRERQREIGELLVNVPKHNASLTLGVIDDYAQVLNDIIICGLPGGGEDPRSPINSCSYVPQERRG